ncbi:MAG: PE-PPE domain-containing protein, partial [Mycobacterium sp.]
TIDASGAGGEADIVQAVQQHLGQATAQNPIVLFGYSQGSWLLGQVQSELEAAGVPSHDVHIVMVGDTGAPNGGLLQRFDLPNGTEPTIPSLGLTFTQGQPSDLYPTDVYTLEYDGWADFPRYPTNVLADLNALLGMFIEHLAYFGVTSEQIQDAIQLPTSAADILTHYYMMPQDLPLLDPLRLIPVLGNPLADLLEPDMQVLVNLGYGSITDGWDPGDADVQTPLGFQPSSSVLEQVPAALINGAQQGITQAIDDLENPQNYTQLTPTWLEQLLTAAKALALISDPASMDASVTQFSDAVATVGAFPSVTAGPPPSGLLESLGAIANQLANELSSAFTPIHTGNPQIDTLEALVFTLPLYDLHIMASELESGNLVDAIALPLAADEDLLPLISAALFS